MVFYLIGLGMELKGISSEAFEIVKKCDKVYVENYTVSFPYTFKELSKFLGKEVVELTRDPVEKEEFLGDAKKQDVALLVFGSPLAATTHISLILKCRKEKIKYRVLQNASVFDSIASIGLQMYKFGKTASMPAWKHNFTPDSFLVIVSDNLRINAHTLLLIDIGLSSKDAIEQLQKASESRNLKLDKIIVVSNGGTEREKIYFETLDSLKKKKIEMPFCFIIPAELHFVEQEALEVLKN